MKLIIIGILVGFVTPSNGFAPAILQLAQKYDRNINRYGLSNVNDYFNSFNNNGNDAKKDQPKSKEAGQGSAYAQTNDYFASFNKPRTDDTNTDRTEKWHGNDNFGLNNYSSDKRKAADEEEKFIPKSYQPQHMTTLEIEEYNNARLCPKMLLTQCAIQSFCYLLEECRDPHSGKWLEEFLQVEGLKNYHGNGAFNITKYPTWDRVLLDVIHQPNEKMIVSAKRRGRGHGGWSKNNPYLQERWVEFHIDILPAYLVQRLLPVREQLSNEFERDLGIIQTVDGMVMESYFNRIRSESPSDSYSQPAFERISSHILANHTEEGAPSPLRRGNFDLLYSLSTHAAAHDLLRQLRDDSQGDVATYEWFKNFYTERVSEYFDGDQAFGRADDFIDALLRTPPSFVELHDTRKPDLVEPLHLAERIISIRSEICDEWKHVMREVKADHLRLHDIIVRVMMGKAFESSESDRGIEIIEEKKWEISDDIGAFE